MFRIIRVLQNHDMRVSVVFIAFLVSFLHASFCRIHCLPGVFWYASLVLPSWCFPACEFLSYSFPSWCLSGMRVSLVFISVFPACEFLSYSLPSWCLSDVRVSLVFIAFLVFSGMRVSLVFRCLSGNVYVLLNFHREFASLHFPVWVCLAAPAWEFLVLFAFQAFLVFNFQRFRAFMKHNQPLTEYLMELYWTITSEQLSMLISMKKEINLQIPWKYPQEKLFWNQTNHSEAFRSSGIGCTDLEVWGCWDI